MRPINKHLGRKVSMLIGLVFVFVSTILFWFIFDLETIARVEVTLIVACVLLGIGTSVTNVCSFSLTSDLIGLNTESGAFVYGIMSFADKLANGLIIASIQQFNPCTTDTPTKCGFYYRQILTFIPAAVSIATVFMIISIWRTNIGGNRHEMIRPDRTVLVQRKANILNDQYDERTSLIA
jgi:Na+/melibiose symporter-like transporter